MSTPEPTTRAPSALRQASGRVAALRRWHPGTSEAVEAERDYAAALLAERIAEIVAKFPPLTEQQRDKVAALLRTPTGGRSG